MAMLVYSDKCPYSSQIIRDIQENPALLHVIRFHNVTTHGVPSKQVTRVPTLITNTGQFLVGQEVRAWIESMAPVEEVDAVDASGFQTSLLDGEDESTDMFDLDRYGTSLAPQMTRALEEKINRKTQDAYAALQNSK